VPWNIHIEDTTESVEEALQKWRDFADGNVSIMKCCEKANEKNRYKRHDHQKMTTDIGEVDEA